MRGQALGQHDRVLDRLAAALPEVRRHRMRGVAEEHTVWPRCQRRMGGRSVASVRRIRSARVASSTRAIGACHEAKRRASSAWTSPSAPPAGALAGREPVDLAVADRHDAEALSTPPGLGRSRGRLHGFGRRHAAPRRVPGVRRFAVREERGTHGRAEPVGADEKVAIDRLAVREACDRR